MMASNNSSSSRETRRRRIVERGSDRLALITGRIQNLPPISSDSPPPQDSSAISSPPLLSTDRNLQSHLLAVQSTVSPHGEDEFSGSVLPKHDSGAESNQINGNNGGSSELNTGSCETSIEGLRVPAPEVSEEVQPSLVSPTAQKLPFSTDKGESLQPLTRTVSVFTPNKISSAITALERNRFFCSLTVALLTVLSYLGFPLLGSAFMKSTIFSRPLYLVLLTNLTILLARLLGKQRNLERGGNGAVGMVPSLEGYGWAEQIGNVVEVGLALQKVIDAVFMDCGVYAIIVICSLTLAHQLGL